VLNNKYPSAVLFVLVFAFGCKKAASVTGKSDPQTTVDTAIAVGNSLSSTTVYHQLTNGYQAYRIPALLLTTNGTLLAFCEARRRASSGDAGEINVVFKRSADNGATWSDQQIVFQDSLNTCGNPTLVQDKNTGTIWLLMSHNPGRDLETTIIKGSDYLARTVWISRSDDDGVTWSTPRDITTSVKDTSWRWYATGPGTGIQIAHGTYAGRLIVPCDHSYLVNNKTPVYASHIIYSDDDGATWHTGGSAGTNTNECQVAELNDGKGTLILNDRYLSKPYTRKQALSYDGGMTWSAVTSLSSIADPCCEGSLYSYQGSGLLLSNCDTTAVRANLTLSSSFNKGATWRRVYTIYKGPSAYSSLSVSPGGNIMCLFECGVTHPNEGITFNILSTNPKTALVR